MNEFYTQAILAIIATMASFVGLVISKEQKTSEFRQVWINTLRDDISKFLGQVDKIQKLILIHKTTEKEQQKETSNTVITDSVGLIELKFKIELLINPKENEHI